MTENFLNLHVLLTTSVANPNRDDTGAPKQVTYGGVTRHRMSSQAMTRAKRVAFELAAGGDQVSWRAKGGMVDKAVALAASLAEQSGSPLTAAERTDLEVPLTIAVQGLVVNREKAQKAADERRRVKAAAKPAPGEADGATADAEDDTGTGKKDTLVWLAEHELQLMATAALARLRGGDTAATDFVNKGGKTLSLSIAAFGRMFAFRPDLQNEAAVQRSHAFTTHAADVEPDYFTAVDDLVPIEAGKGAGHLAINQFGGGVYYWHANVDRAQLWATWIPDTDEASTRSRLTQFFEALLTALPSGKQATTAHKTLPDAVLAVPSTQPVALHQAFERPVPPGKRNGGYRDDSLTALLAADQQVRGFTPRAFPSGAHLATTLDRADDTSVTRAANLDDMIATCVDWALAGRPSI